MKEIDYKELKKYSNLPKLDIGTVPISGGYLFNPNQVLAGYFTQNLTPVTNSFVPEATSQGISNASSLVTSLGLNIAKSFPAYREAFKATTDKYAQLYAKAGASSGIAEEAFVNAGKSAAKDAAKTAASKAIGAAGTALNVYSTLHSALGLKNVMEDSETLSPGDLSTLSSKSTEYANGVGFERMGGYDAVGVDKYVSDLNKANKISGITSGLEAGAGIGGIIGTLLPGGPLTGLLGAGIGGLLGALGGGLFGSSARRKRERAIAQAKRDYATISDAFNTQNESEAATKGLQNEFYATHADKGLRKCDNGFALVNDEEVVGNTEKDQNGNVHITDVHVVHSPFGRADVKLEKVDPKGGFVFGHLKDEHGEEMNKKAAPLTQMFNSGNPYLQQVAEKGLLALLDELSSIKKNNNPKPQYAKDIEKYADGMPLADKGKNMKRCDKGSFSGAWIPTMAFGANELDNWAHKKEIDRMPITAFNANTYNPYILLAGALMPTTYEIGPQKQTINDLFGFAKYAIDLSAYSPGQKMALLSNMWNKRMKAMSDLMGEKHQQENTMRANYAKWLSEVGAQEQQMKSAYMQKYYDQLAQANSRKFNALQTLRKDKRQNWNDFAQNMYNIWYGNKNIGLYEQKLTDENERFLKELEQKGKELALREKEASKTSPATEAAYTPIATFEQFINSPYGLAAFGERNRRKRTQPKMEGV